MRIIVCYKYVRSESEVTVNDDRTLNVDNASWGISQYDVNAVETAMKLAEAEEGSSVEVLTVGGDVIDNSKMRKAILSRGPSKMHAVKCGECGDMFETASLLAQAVERLGDVDLIICGDGSGDMYSQTMGNILAGIMGVPAINCVSSLGFEDGKLIAVRSLKNSSERFELCGLSVVSVTSDICRARIPSMKDILSAGKKPVELLNADEMKRTASKTTELSVRAPEKRQRSSIIYSGENAVERFASALCEHI